MSLLLYPPRPISIHALREEGDRHRWGICSSGWQFLSTPSVRRATKPDPLDIDAEVISIHALREEGDKATNRNRTGYKHFYPRPP